MRRRAAGRTVGRVPLLSGIFRSQAIYGSADTWSSRLAGRQGGEWARRTVAAAMPARPQGMSEDAIRDLQARGVITEAEARQLAARARGQA